MHIKGMHNTVGDTISQLDFGRVKDDKLGDIHERVVSLHYAQFKCREHFQSFANHSKEDVIYPLTVKEIAQTQKDDAVLKILHKHDKYSTQLVVDTQVQHKDGIPTVIQNGEVSWYHYYTQHPGHIHLEETLHAVMYQKGMRHARKV